MDPEIPQEFFLDTALTGDNAHSKDEQTIHYADATLRRLSPCSVEHKGENKGAQEIETHMGFLGDEAEEGRIKIEEAETGTDEFEPECCRTFERPLLAHAFSNESLLMEKMIQFS